MFKKLAGLTVLAGLFIAGTAGAAVTGSSHDLSAEIASLDDVCSICHAPHSNVNNPADGMLWNHIDGTITSYAVYSSLTMEAPGGQPGPTSLLCLSCHDGSVAVDSFGIKGTARTGTLFIDNAAFTQAGGLNQMGAALSDDHPIGMTYNVADGELNATTTGLSFNDGATSGTVADLLFGAGTVECASCHDVHNTQSSAGANGEGLLRVSNAGSGLCTTCHAK